MIDFLTCCIYDGRHNLCILNTYLYRKQHSYLFLLVVYDQNRRALGHGKAGDSFFRTFGGGAIADERVFGGWGKLGRPFARGFRASYFCAHKDNTELCLKT